MSYAGGGVAILPVAVPPNIADDAPAVPFGRIRSCSSPKLRRREEAKALA
jgi:hypothetical protein